MNAAIILFLVIIRHATKRRIIFAKVQDSKLFTIDKISNVPGYIVSYWLNRLEKEGIICKHRAMAFSLQEQIYTKQVNNKFLF